MTAVGIGCRPSKKDCCCRLLAICDRIAELRAQLLDGSQTATQIAAGLEDVNAKIKSTATDVVCLPDPLIDNGHFM